jgi:hypothetical protein
MRAERPALGVGQQQNPLAPLKASVASSDGDRPSREELSSDLFGDSSCIPRTPLPHRSDQICENGVQKDCGGTNMLENILRNLQSVPGKL